ncbi:MAG: acetyl-CoA carboxylase biotin carboxyl carrier protein [Ruminococcus sp.]|nr:acetyl-CoA carboxylase biotin carboxyl carrier protein [Ruminococcus sp.]
MSEIFGMIDLETIEKLAGIVSKNELSELSLSDGDKTITVKGKKNVVYESQTQKNVKPVIESDDEDNDNEDEGNVVRCPIVGTFYASPSPDKPPFVNVGDRVSKGDVLMIIESMKLMNEIQSEFDGVVQSILVSNGQTVEYDQPIMIIK